MTRPNLLSLSKRVIVLGSRVQAQPSATVMWSSCPRAQGGKSRSPSSIEVTFIYYVSTFLGLFGPSTPLRKCHCKCCSSSFIATYLHFLLHSHSEKWMLDFFQFWTKKAHLVKVQIFWEGHKIWKNLPLKIWHYTLETKFLFFSFLCS